MSKALLKIKLEQQATPVQATNNILDSRKVNIPLGHILIQSSDKHGILEKVIFQTPVKFPPEHVLHLGVGVGEPFNRWGMGSGGI